VDSQRDRVGPFAEAVAFTLRELAGVEATPERTWQATGSDGFGDVTAVVRLTVGEGGYFALSFATTTATEIGRASCRERV